MPDPSFHRLYDNNEISRVLKRASEIQNEGGKGKTYGLSLEELKQVAAEAGIDPVHVMAAASELELGGGSGKSFHWLGGPTSFSKARVVQGEGREEQWEELVAEIRRTLDMVGSTSQVGRSLDWTYHSRFQQVQVTASSRGGQTKLHIHQQLSKIALATFAPLTVISIQLLIVLLAVLEVGPLAGMGISIGVIMAMLLTARAIFGWIARTKARKMETLLDRLEGIVETSNSTDAVLDGKVPLPGGSVLDTHDVVSEEQRMPGPRSKTSS